MHTLRVLRNGVELLSTASDAVAWPSWDVIACRNEAHYAGVSVGGAVEVQPGVYDTLQWLEFMPLEPGDSLELQVVRGSGSTPAASRSTAAENEALRQRFNSAEAASEYDAIRTGPRQEFRASCALRVNAPGPRQVEVSAASPIETIFASGLWSSQHKPEQWLLRVATYPHAEPNAQSSQWWSSIEEPTRVVLGT